MPACGAMKTPPAPRPRPATSGPIVASIQAGEALAFLQPEILALPDDVLAGLIAAPEPRRPTATCSKTSSAAAPTSGPKRSRKSSPSSPMSPAPAVRSVQRPRQRRPLSSARSTDEDGNVVELVQGALRQVHGKPESRRPAARVRGDGGGVRRRMAHTLASLHGSSVRKDVAAARVRGYESALEEALFDDNMPTSVYHSLLDVVQEAKPLLERSLNLRKRALGRRPAPAATTCACRWRRNRRATYDYREAVDIVLDGVGALGERYVERPADRLQLPLGRCPRDQRTSAPAPTRGASTVPRLSC